MVSLILFGCESNKENKTSMNKKDNFKYQTEQFADLGILRYQVPGFEDLSIKRKKTGLLFIPGGSFRQRYNLRSELQT